MWCQVEADEGLFIVVVVVVVVGGGGYHGLTWRLLERVERVDRGYRYRRPGARTYHTIDIASDLNQQVVRAAILEE